MKRSSFNVLFFLKKTKLLKNGEASVCVFLGCNRAWILKTLELCDGGYPQVGTVQLNLIHFIW